MATLSLYTSLFSGACCAPSEVDVQYFETEWEQGDLFEGKTPQDFGFADEPPSAEESPRAPRYLSSR